MRPDPRCGSGMGTRSRSRPASRWFGWAGTLRVGPSYTGRTGSKVAAVTALGRHPASSPERARQLHVVVSEPNPALRYDSSGDLMKILEPFAFDAVYGSFSGRSRSTRWASRWLRRRLHAHASRVLARHSRVSMRRLPLVAQSRHFRASNQCPLLGVKRTCLFAVRMSASDPKRTLGAARC